ncbi:hypothetical protein B0O99DRAFT_598826 [Bisporella sp. PMI_857]|nr:hypothetical protein B0O99DRAFT_598826 [Bisporella sp. PMI_857]
MAPSAPTPVEVGLGKVGSNSHPIHPATAHNPIAFFIFSSLFDVLSYTIFRFPTFFHPIVKTFSTSYTSTTTIAVIHHLQLFAYWLNILGIVTSLPAVSTGLLEFYAMVKAKGLNLQNQTVKTAVFHAALADVTLGIAVWQLVVKHVEEEHVPQGKSALISVALLLAIGNTAALGGIWYIRMDTG